MALEIRSAKTFPTVNCVSNEESQATQALLMKIASRTKAIDPQWLRYSIYGVAIRTNCSYYNSTTASIVSADNNTKYPYEIFIPDSPVDFGIHTRHL